METREILNLTYLCRDGKIVDEQRIYVCVRSDHIYFAFLFVLSHFGFVTSTLQIIKLHSFMVSMSNISINMAALPDSCCTAGTHSVF